VIGKIGINKKAGVLIYLSIGVSVYLSAIGMEPSPLPCS